MGSTIVLAKFTDSKIVLSNNYRELVKESLI